MSKYDRRRKELTDALESGEYEQATGALCKEIDGESTYCCLGVACEVYNNAMKRSKKKTLPISSIGNSGFFLREYNGSTGNLPEEVREYFNFRDWDGSYGDCSSLVDDNDYGTSFKEIAKIIKSKPEGLFND